jgi:hypothetical protein
MRPADKPSAVDHHKRQRHIRLDDDRKRAPFPRGHVDFAPQLFRSDRIAFRQDRASRDISDAHAHAVTKENLSERNPSLAGNGESLDSPAKLLFERAPQPGLKQMTAFGHD